MHSHCSSALGFLIFFPARPLAPFSCTVPLTLHKPPTSTNPTPTPCPIHGYTSCVPVHPDERANRGQKCVLGFDAELCALVWGCISCMTVCAILYKCILWTNRLWSLRCLFYPFFSMYFYKWPWIPCGLQWDTVITKRRACATPKLNIHIYMKEQKIMFRSSSF